ncbi:MAG: glucose 1-dehydrogenase [Bacteroidota bacterium]
MHTFENNIAVITGGGSGIGQATALAAAQAGASVLVSDLHLDKAQETTDLITGTGGTALPLQVDVTQAEQTRHLCEVARKEFGGIHFLCNSAGLQTYGTVETTSEETWDQTLSVNLKGMFLVAKFAVPEIRRMGGGAIVNITSVQGLQCQPNVSAYAASKGGVIALTRSMALDYAKENIRVNCICPGSIDTPLLRYGAAQHGPVEEILQEWGSHHPIGRIGKAEEIAQTVLFLWSDAAGFLLGQPIVVDGGLTSQIL